MTIPTMQNPQTNCSQQSTTLAVEKTEHYTSHVCMHNSHFTGSINLFAHTTRMDGTMSRQ